MVYCQNSAFVVYIILFTGTWCFNYDYTVHVTPGKRECFYQPIDAGDVKVEFEYQVTNILSL